MDELSTTVLQHQAGSFETNAANRHQV